MAKPIKYLLLVLFCTVIFRNALIAQIPEGISPTEVGALAEIFLKSAEQDRQLFLRNSCNQLKSIRQKEEKLKHHLDADILQQSEALTNDLQSKIEEIESLISHPEILLKNLPTGPYIARFDSLSSLFEFADAGSNLSPYLLEAKKKLIQIKQQLYYSEKLNEWLTNREQQWSQMLLGSGKLIPATMKDLFNEWQVELNIYKQQFYNWKQALNDSKRMEREVLALLNKLPAFRDFMGRNSELARLFGSSSGTDVPGLTDPYSGLQTIQSMTQDLQNRFGANALQNSGALQQQLQNGIDQLNQNQASPLQEILPEFELPSPGGRGVGGEVSPAQQESATLKSKSFKQRLEIGWNVQSALRIQDFPAIRDAAITLTYKLNPRSYLGVGLAYKFALGNNWKDIEWTHEGVGFRSSFDWRIAEAGGKLFKSLWVTGGFEMNYWSRIANNSQWKDLAWRPAGIVGITKTIPVKKNTAKLQILFNFLETNLPLEDRISVRWGKTF